MSIHEAVNALETSFRDTIIAGDVVKLERFLASDFVYTTATGDVWNRDRFLTTVHSGDLKVNSVEWMKAKIQTDRMEREVVLSGFASVSLTIKGHPFSGSLTFTRVWKKADGADWQLSRIEAYDSDIQKEWRTLTEVHH